MALLEVNAFSSIVPGKSPEHSITNSLEAGATIGQGISEGPESGCPSVCWHYRYCGLQGTHLHASSLPGPECFSRNQLPLHLRLQLTHMTEIND